MNAIAKVFGILLGFIGGWLIIFLISLGLTSAISPPPYTGNPADIDAKGHLEQLHEIHMAGLSVFIASIGGILGGVLGLRWIDRVSRKG